MHNACQNFIAFFASFSQGEEEEEEGEQEEKVREASTHGAGKGAASKQADGGACSIFKPSCEKQFNCDQCDFASDSQRGLKVHVSKSHKDPEALRAEDQNISLTLSELGEVREDSFVQADIQEEATEPAHPHPDWVICPRLLCQRARVQLEEEIKKKIRPYVASTFG